LNTPSEEEMKTKEINIAVNIDKIDENLYGIKEFE